MSNPIQDIVCAFINCGQGKCVASNTTGIGFDCDCQSGWKKMQIGPLTFPSCVVPNCTIDFQCNGSPPPPPPPTPPAAAPPPPPFTLANPCTFTWCGDGTCVTNGTGYNCQCNEGSANLMNLSGLACFKKCYFGADCNVASPPSGNSGSQGAREVPNCSRNLHILTMTIVVAFFITWI
ncbi:neurogenic locus notch-like protein 3-like [Quillaja saponaria]|uniref:Neurogenic locus notch-like protein 3-like n=1 Tax=Quillaja saponaria TaxID=32244 RepID=A0AAD7LRT8_QUISA|nr:neurogenic locus notch-like protein 3-like [Quillaja saponaria]